MKLGTLRSGRDGKLVVIDRNLKWVKPVPQIAHTFQQALDNWRELGPKLQKEFEVLDAGNHNGALPYHPESMHSPLPRAYQWVDGSAYLNHVELVRKSRGAEMPKEFLTDPLMYQGCSDAFLAPTDPICLASEEWGIDFESEVAVITDDVPMGSNSAQCLGHIRFVVLVNDVSLRGLIPAELAKGFGFLVSKPASAFSPVAVTPEELGNAWRGGKLHLPLRTTWNGNLYGEPNAGIDMQFDFPTIIAHAAKTRNLCAGTIVGSGTVSNRDQKAGSSCILEKRSLETIASGKPSTSFLKFGDHVKIEMLDENQKSIFGAIDQKVEKYTPPA